MALAVQPLRFVQTRMMLDVGGGVHGPRLFRSGLDVCRGVTSKSGPLALYTGTLGSAAGMAVSRGIYFGLYPALTAPDHSLLRASSCLMSLVSATRY